MPVRRLLVAAAGVLTAVLLGAAPASAHCTFDLDRDRTRPGGEFYAYGSMTVGEYVEIRWGSEGGPVLDSFVVAGSRGSLGVDDNQSPQGDYRRRLVTPPNAVPGWTKVLAVIDPNWGYDQDENKTRSRYTFTRVILVEDPAAPAPPAVVNQRPPTSPDHTPLRDVPAPQPQPEPAPATQPAHAPARAPARAPVPAAQAQIQTQSQPAEAAEPSWQWDRAGQWARSGARSPAAVPPPIGDGRSPTTSGFAEALRAVAASLGAVAARPPAASLPFALVAALAAALAGRRHRHSSARP